MKLSQLFETITEFEQLMYDKYNLRTFFVIERPDELALGILEIPKADRKKGIGTAVMQDLVDYADDLQKRIVLTPSGRNLDVGTTSRGRLVKFYKRFGFVENKGRNKDFEISDGMYRLPK